MESITDRDVDPIKKFLGHAPYSVLQALGPESDFGPKYYHGNESLEDNGLTISKTVFPNVLKVVAGPGVNLLVWVDELKRRVIVTNHRRLTVTQGDKEIAVEVNAPHHGTVDRTDIVEGFFKTFMRVVDFSVGLTEARGYDTPSFYRQNRTYHVGRERHTVSSPPSQETAKTIGGTATHKSMQSPAPEAPNNDEPTPPRLEDRYGKALPEIKKPEGLTLDDIGGLEEVKRILKDVAVSFQHAEVMQKWGAERPQGVLLYGPPGTGKTMLARALAAEIDAEMMMVQGTDVYGMWLGESEKRIKEIFTNARQHEGRLILFFDEVESIIGITGNPSSGGADNSRNAVAGIFKQELNTLAEENPNVLVVAATNFLEQIDPSLIRSGRFDIRVRVPMPDQEARVQILDSIMNRHMAKTGSEMFGSDIDTALLAEMADGLSGADITEIFRRLIMDKAMSEARGGFSSGLSVSQAEIEQAVALFKANNQ